MRTFEVFRNGCNLQQKLKEILINLWDDSHFEIVCPLNLYNSPEEAFYSFTAFQNVYGNIGVSFHFYRLVFDPDDSADYAISVAKELADGFLEGFQSIIALVHGLTVEPHIVMVVNSVSNNGQKLYDNNTVLVKIMQELGNITEEAWCANTGVTLFDGARKLQDRYENLTGEGIQ